jgi:hypothetical protein
MLGFTALRAGSALTCQRRPDRAPGTAYQPIQE